MAALSSIALTKVLKPPSAVANTLDWRKASGGVATAMTIDVHADRIGLALATLRSESDCDMEVHQRRRSRGLSSMYRNGNDHSRGYNNNYSFSCTVLDSIPLVGKRKKVMPSDAKRRISGLVRAHNICGFVVSWPLQQDTGLMGASCGRTLWALEQLLEDCEDGSSITTTDPLFANNRPLCLWDGVRREQPATDAFGRSSVYARTSTKTEHCASKEQYHQDESVLAAEVWKDFCEHHWPAAIDVAARKNDCDTGTLANTMQIPTNTNNGGGLRIQSSKHQHQHVHANANANPERRTLVAA
jgi:hypothetical protein